MNGPRRKSLVAGVYAAGSLGQIQPTKTTGFPRKLPCRRGHSWIFGEESAVCTACGFTCDKTKTHLYPGGRSLNQDPQA